jgi:GAF domain-containing protein
LSGRVVLVILWWQCPIGIISFVDLTRTWFKAKRGIDLSELPREQTPCNYLLEQGAPEFLVINNMQLDLRFCDAPIVTGPLSVRFYAGVVLKQGKFRLGTLCVMDTVPRRQILPWGTALLGLAAEVADLINSKYVRLQ